MQYGIFADLTVLTHFLWILFLIFGSLWGVRRRAVKILHISGLAFALVIQVFGWYCPLTYLEVWLRAKQNPSLTYRGSFIVHYMERFVYLDLSRTTITMLTILLCTFTAWFYLRKKNSRQK